MRKTIQHLRKLNEIRKEDGVLSALRYDAKETFRPAYEDAKKLVEHSKKATDYSIDFAQKHWKKGVAVAGLAAIIGGLALGVKYVSDKAEFEGYLLGLQDGTINAVNEVYGTDLERVQMPNDPDNTMFYVDRKTGNYHVIDAVETRVPIIARNLK